MPASEPDSSHASQCDERPSAASGDPQHYSSSSSTRDAKPCWQAGFWRWVIFRDLAREQRDEQVTPIDWLVGLGRQAAREGLASSWSRGREVPAGTYAPR